MARVIKHKNTEKSETDDFTLDLIDALNKERGEVVAYNLSVDQSPTHVKRWIPTGIKGLDYICANRRGGGLPEGRIIEIFGAPSLGKSHVAAQICRQVQRMGGIAVYIDSETATSVENLNALGIDIRRGFVYVNEHCTENILSIAESTIMKARALKKDVPICIVWDSVAASSPKAELDGEYDKETVGLQARAISKGMRKITGVLGDQNVLFVILNQTRSKIGVMHGDPTTTPGGQAIPFHSSIRIKLNGGQKIANDKKEIIGINVSAKIIKNKVAPPFRAAEFQIHFGVGVKEHEELFAALRTASPMQIGEKVYSMSNSGSWRVLRIFDPNDPENTDWDKPKNLELEKKFYLSEFEHMIDDPEYSEIIELMCEKTFVRVAGGHDPAFEGIDENSYVEMESAANELKEMIGDLSDFEV